MPNQNERAEKFIKAINEDAYLQQKTIKEETDRLRRSELKKARLRARDEIDELTARERDSRRAEISRKYADKSSESKREMLMHRDGILDSVFEDVRKKLAEFSGSEKYGAWLVGNIVRAAKIVDADDMELYLKKGDEKYADEAAKAAKASFEIKTDEDNMLGGFKIVSRSCGICANDTLESRLQDNRDWFLRQFGGDVAKRD
ncbi:MAG: V-type ATP synthase subunit E [Clostridia bacterium]|nr:V-type ATP synthase subunit E [Clostridia bacterium]